MDAILSNRGVLSRALKVVADKSTGQGCEVKNIPKPVISEQQILVKVHAVALNPVDFKSIDILAPRHSLIGCDYAGEIAEVGKSAPGNWKVGDRVAGFVHGGHSSDVGSFAKYLKVDGDLAWRIPESMGFEEASTYGTPAVTAMLALHVHLELPLLDSSGSPAPPSNPGIVLIYAGSTSVGLFAIQLAKAAGYNVVTTASPRSFELVKKYGADSAFDYHSATASADIAKAFPSITKAFDCISEGQSTKFCDEVLKGNSGKVITLGDRGKSKIVGVENESMVVFTVFGKAFSWLPPIGPSFPASTVDRQALVQFYSALPLHTEQVKPPPMKNVGSGLNNIILGLNELREGKVSGQKLVAALE
ncbi:hypothetical protein IFR05_001668 [Cadophora sp. M221]|nr:hypothetical protein IFR05_001668 [Cadophora sp. M221]